MRPYFPDKDFEKEIMMEDKKTRKEEFQVDGDKLNMRAIFAASSLKMKKDAY